MARARKAGNKYVGGGSESIKTDTVPGITENCPGVGRDEASLPDPALDSQKAVEIAHLEEERKNLEFEVNDGYWAANEAMKKLKAVDLKLKELGVGPKEVVLAKPEVLAISLSPGDRCYGWSIRWHGAIIDLFEDGTIHLTHPAKEEDEKTV